MNIPGCLQSRFVSAGIRTVIDRAGRPFSGEKQALGSLCTLHRFSEDLALVPASGLRHRIGAEGGRIEAPACDLDSLFLNVVIDPFFTGHVGKSGPGDCNREIVAFRVAFTGTVLQAVTPLLQRPGPVPAKEADSDVLVQ